MTDSATRYAPGWPGIPPRWTSSAKTGVGTALNQHSKVWFTVSHGILNEVYFPRVDQACTRDMGFIVTNGRDFSPRRSATAHLKTVRSSPAVPVFELINTCVRRTIPNPQRGAHRSLPQRGAAKGPLRAAARATLRLSPLCLALAPSGQLRIRQHRLDRRLQRLSHVFRRARRCHAGAGVFGPVEENCRSGFVGTSDGWQDLSQHFQMEWEYTRAENGNIAFTGEIDLAACNGEFVLALGFGAIWTEAGQQARSSLVRRLRRDSRALRLAVEKLANDSCSSSTNRCARTILYRSSTAVLRTHESKDFLGGIIASLSIPWGFNKGDEDLGGYHLVWPRDLVETAGALLAAGAVSRRGARAALSGSHAGSRRATGRRICGSTDAPTGAAFRWTRPRSPSCCSICCAAKPPSALGKLDRWWPMVRNAVSFILRNGPVTQQDRWEEDAGYSPFTLAAEISALLAAADIADLTGHADQAQTMRDTADAWNDNIERWIYATGGDLAQQLGIDGYYVRIAPPDTESLAPLRQRKALSPSRIVRRARMGARMASAPITSSVPMRWRWCASACARLTIRAF